MPKVKSRKCKYGQLKSPVKTSSGKKRYCKKHPKNKGRPSRKRRVGRPSRKRRVGRPSKRRSRRRVGRPSRKRRVSRKTSRKCKYGQLKSPVKTSSGRKRYCKKRRVGRPASRKITKKPSRRRRSSKRGTKSKTHKGDKNYTTKRGDKVFHRRRHNVKKSRAPYRKTVAQKKEDCKNQGKVYNSKTKRCNKKKSRVSMAIRRFKSKGYHHKQAVAMALNMHKKGRLGVRGGYIKKSK